MYSAVCRSVIDTDRTARIGSRQVRRCLVCRSEENGTGNGRTRCAAVDNERLQRMVADSAQPEMEQTSAAVQFRRFVTFADYQ